MIEWIKNVDLIRNWQWDIWHIACTLFILCIAGAIRWIYLDSWGKNKKTKVNGNQ
jgi:hypothetical protein